MNEKIYNAQIKNNKDKTGDTTGTRIMFMVGSVIIVILTSMLMGFILNYVGLFDWGDF